MRGFCQTMALVAMGAALAGCESKNDSPANAALPSGSVMLKVPGMT